MTFDRLVELSAAVLAPIVAIVGIGSVIASAVHAKRLRKDALFDRRYAFYVRLRNIWLATGTGAPPNEDPYLSIEDLAPLADEAAWLFGEDIAKHILDLDRKGHTGSPFFPNEDFTAPFNRYLQL
ncbi:MAG TPA: hypothetical protein VFN22_06745 [Gemmatimonadales bacterium]|nr:hypothetical protein [Gemmatimonadales bacterium]